MAKKTSQAKVSQQEKEKSFEVAMQAITIIDAGQCHAACQEGGIESQEFKCRFSLIAAIGGKLRLYCHRHPLHHHKIAFDATLKEGHDEFVQHKCIVPITYKLSRMSRTGYVVFQITHENPQQVNVAIQFDSPALASWADTCGK